MARWTFLTSHAPVLLLVAHDPGVRLRYIAASLDITARGAFGIITDLVQARYVINEKNGRRNRYHIRSHLPLPEPTSQERTIGEVLALLTGTGPPASCSPAGAASASPGKQVPSEPPVSPRAAAIDGGARGARYRAEGGRQGHDRRMDRER